MGLNTWLVRSCIRYLEVLQVEIWISKPSATCFFWNSWHTIGRCVQTSEHNFKPNVQVSTWSISRYPCHFWLTRCLIQCITSNLVWRMPGSDHVCWFYFSTSSFTIPLALPSDSRFKKGTEVRGVLPHVQLSVLATICFAIGERGPAPCPTLGLDHYIAVIFCFVWVCVVL